MVLEKLSTEINYASDGTGQREQTYAIRVQSEEGVRAVGVLTFSYNAENEDLEFVYIRVRKPDGSTVSTPADGVQDIASEVTRVAPTYSDLREKQVPVRALNAGDVLEYKVRVTQTKPDVPNQFWYAHSFVKAGIVLEETLRITVPASQYVKVVSAEVQPELTQSGGQKTYFWKTANLKAPDPDNDKNDQDADKDSDNPEENGTPSVQLTTFRSWEEIGRWYSQLAASRSAVTPAISAKAADLTKGLTTTDEKLRAIYAYVSLKFRYISISFGQGRFQPHSADEVLANQYGDCKDKHTLFAALLKAAGVEAWPALIGLGVKFDADVPSPAQFNHVITVIPGNASPQWLDTTPEVAPFGLLQQQIRDKQALVIPVSGTPSLMKTPENPPFQNSERIESKAELSADGTLKGHIDVTLRGDAELILRSVFHSLSAAQWQEAMQRMSESWGFQGKVSHVEVDNLNTPEKPFHYGYDYTRENYGDWANRRILPLMPPLVLADPGDKPPKQPVDFSDWGDITYVSSIKLPAGYSVEIPTGTHAESSLGNFTSSYSVKEGALNVERQFLLRKPKLAVAEWAEYKTFQKGAAGDADQWIQLSASSGSAGTAVSQNNPEAQRLIEQAANALQRGDMNEARDAVARAERINPNQRDLWSMRGYIAAASRDVPKATENLKKEIQLHPDNLVAYRMLSQMQMSSRDEKGAIATLRGLLKAAPGEPEAAVTLARLLDADKNYADAIDILRPAVAAAPKNTDLQMEMANAMLRSGRKDEGVAATKAFADSATEAQVLNGAAWNLAESNTEIPLAIAYAKKAVSKVEDDSKAVKLGSLENEDLGRVSSVGAYWDTLGWAMFKAGDTANAEKYIEAAWILTEIGEAGDHLGQLYEKQGRKEDARHTYELALAASTSLTETSERLDRLGGPENTDERPTLRRDAARAPKPAGPPRISPEEELGRLRTADVPLLKEQKGTAEFFLSFSKAGLEETLFISGDENLRTAGGAFAKATFRMPFPDDGPEKIIRRGILTCSAVTKPSCQLVFMLPSVTTAN